MNVDSIGDLYTIDGAARALNTTYNTIKGYIRRRRVKTVRLGGKTTLVRLADLEGLRK